MAGEPVQLATPSAAITTPATEVVALGNHDDSNPVPTPVDYATADVTVLRAAVEERDNYISNLIRRMSNTSGPMQPINWDVLATIAPEDVRGRLEVLEKRLTEQVQREELQLSLERARVARDKSKLSQMKQQLERRMKHMGIEVDQLDPSKTAAAAPPRDPAAKGAPDRSWRSLFSK